MSNMTDTGSASATKRAAAKRATANVRVVERVAAKAKVAAAKRVAVKAKIAAKRAVAKVVEVEVPADWSSQDLAARAVQNTGGRTGAAGSDSIPAKRWPPRRSWAAASSPPANRHPEPM